MEIGSRMPYRGAECEKLALSTPGICERRVCSFWYKSSKRLAGYSLWAKLIQAMSRPWVSMPSGCVSNRRRLSVNKAAVINRTKEMPA